MGSLPNTRGAGKLGGKPGAVEGSESNDTAYPRGAGLLPSWPHAAETIFCVCDGGGRGGIEQGRRGWGGDGARLTMRECGKTSCRPAQPALPSGFALLCPQPPVSFLPFANFKLHRDTPMRFVFVLPSPWWGLQREQQGTPVNTAATGRKNFARARTHTKTRAHTSLFSEKGGTVAACDVEQPTNLY